MKFIVARPSLWLLPLGVILLFGIISLFSSLGSTAEIPETGGEPGSGDSVQASLPATPAAQTQVDATAAPSPSPMPPTPTATPVPSLRQLTSGGCCVQAFWHPDGQRLLYIDKPGPDQPAGLWSVDLNAGPPVFYTEKVGLYSKDMQYRAFLSGEVTTIERLADGQTWPIPNDGRAVVFSPDGEWIAWTAGQSGPPFDSARREIWAGRVDGSQARSLLPLFSASVIDWFPDGRGLLVSGRIDPSAADQSLFSLAFDPDSQPAPIEELLQTGRLNLLAQGNRVRGASLSPDGGYLAYQITMDADESKNGLWVVGIHSNQPPQRLSLYGAYRWRDASRLLVVPLQLGEAHRLWEFDARNLETGPVPLTDPAVTAFTVANGDWSVSPDGRHVAFLSAEERNIWLISLTPANP